MATTVQERIIPASDTLVKYDNPVLITIRPEKASKDVTASKAGTAGCKIQNITPIADIRREPVEILNGILPPREWEEEGHMWVQQVSSTPATRLDVINLQEQLDMRLQQRQARETGICPIRRELYTQCFECYFDGCFNTLAKETACAGLCLIMVGIKDRAYTAEDIV